MDKKKYQIFISSTYTDLTEIRKKIQETILSMYHFPMGMEMFSAGDEEQWEVIKETIDSSDYYVLVIGHRYGSETLEGISYTEKEYEYAKENRVPILVFIRDRNIPLKSDERDDNHDKITKLNKFIDKAKSNRMCEFWNTKEDLALKVSLALNKQFNKKQRPGWIRADNIDFTEISNELMKLSQENRILREENEKFKKQFAAKKPMLNLEINNGKPLEYYLKEFDNIRNQFKELKYEDVPPKLKEYVSQQDIEIYNDALLLSSNEINYYIDEKTRYLRIKNLNHKIIAKVCNDGVVKANDIHINIEFPKDILIMEVYDIDNLEEPVEGNIPENPIKKAEADYSKKNFQYTHKNIIEKMKVNHIGQFDSFPFKSIRSIDKNSYIKNNVLTFKIDDLLHTREISLGEEYRIIPLKIGDFKVKISIICEEYESPLRYEIPIIVKKWDFKCINLK